MAAWCRRCIVTEPQAPLLPPPRPVLVVGVGSELRGDDAVGRHVAEAVAATAPAGVEVRSVHQLTPELAVEWAGRRLVLVVDASVDADADADTVTVSSLPPVEGGAGVMTHHVDPGTLVELAALFGAPPREVVLVGVPAHELGIGMTLSERTREAADLAVGEVMARCQAATSPPAGPAAAAPGCGPVVPSE